MHFKCMKQAVLVPCISVTGNAKGLDYNGFLKNPGYCSVNFLYIPLEFSKEFIDGKSLHNYSEQYNRICHGDHHINSNFIDQTTNLFMQRKGGGQPRFRP